MSPRGSVVIGIDLGTTKIVAIAVDTRQRAIIARHSLVNEASITSDADRARGRSEWDADKIVRTAEQCLTAVARSLADRVHEVAGIGITGQQHGMLIADRPGQPLTPLINWQDRRALEVADANGQTYVQLARQAIGGDAAMRAGCQLQSGFMAVTLVWLQRQGLLPDRGRAHFIMDYFASSITGEVAAADPSCCGSAGVFDVRRRAWQEDAIQALALSPKIFPIVGEASEVVGTLTAALSVATGLPRETPVFVPIGDHQASFLGSVDVPNECTLVNVGTGAQVAAYTDGYEFQTPIELRPCPLAGNLLSNVGLAGGWSYQVLEQFFHDVGVRLGTEAMNDASRQKRYERMNELAASAPPGAAGIRCTPTFGGTRSNPTDFGQFTGVSAQNFTVANMCRATLEGMASGFRQAYDQIFAVLKRRHTRLVGAGNGLRSNPVLVSCLESQFGLPVRFTCHTEEAAFGAAVVAAAACGIFPNLTSASQLVTYSRL